MLERELRDLYAQLRRRAARWAPPDVVDDIVQDAVLVVLEARDRMPVGISRAQYGSGVVRNRAARHFHSRQRASAVDPDVLPAGNCALMKAALEQWAADLIAQAGLSQSHEEILRMYYFEDLSAREIGERLTLPQGTVRGRLACALDHLRHTQRRLQAQQQDRWRVVHLNAELTGESCILHGECMPPVRRQRLNQSGRSRGENFRDRNSAELNNKAATASSPMASRRRRADRIP